MDSRSGQNRQNRFVRKKIRTRTMEKTFSTAASSGHMRVGRTENVTRCDRIVRGARRSE
jgi:hypothetical protein